VHSATTGGGQLMVGTVVSCTRMLLLHELVLPDRSVARYASVVVPSGKEPAGGFVTVTGLQTSLADAAPGVTLADAFPVHSATTGAGQLMVGAVVSCTRMLLLHEPVLPD